MAAGITSASVKESIEQHIDYLNEQIRQTQSLIKDHIEGNPRLRQQRDLLKSIPGIGETTAAKFLAEVVDINYYDSARQVAAFSGLVPKHKESGATVICTSLMLSTRSSARVMAVLLKSCGEGFAKKIALETATGYEERNHQYSPDFLGKPVEITACFAEFVW